MDQQQPPTPPPVAYYRPTPPNNSKAIASLVLGIVGFTAVPLIASALALVFGYKARREIERSEGREGGAGMATAGIVLGWVGLIYGLALATFFVVILVNLMGSA